MSSLNVHSITEIIIPDGDGIEISGGRLRPELLIKEFYDDNLTNAPTNEIRTFGTLIKNRLNYELEGSKNRVTADYTLSGALHEGSGNDDYLDHKVQLGYGYSPTNRIELGILGEYFDTHDPRGTGASEGTGVISQNPDEWHHYRVEADFSYGTRLSKGRIEFDIGHIDKKYDNNRLTTSVRDREDSFGSGRFFYRIMPKTSLIFEGRAIEYHYDENGLGVPSLDNVTTRALFGVIWDSTYKTTGTAKIGYIQKDFDSGLRSTGEDVTWEFDIEWSPKSYSHFNLNTSRDYKETNGTGDFIIRDLINASWSHEWTSKINTKIAISYTDDGFSQDTTGRSDEVFTLEANASYAMLRWLEFGAGYKYDERDSTINTFNYERNIAELFATIYF